MLGRGAAKIGGVRATRIERGKGGEGGFLRLDGELVSGGIAGGASEKQVPPAPGEADEQQQLL